MNLLIATGNQHKFSEISAMLAGPHLVCVSLRQLKGVPEVVEDGDTFEANAIIKAVTLARFSGMWTLADDSGLEVDALNGTPGVYSARYAGNPTDDGANNRKVLAAMQGEINRTARFRCAIALSDPTGVARTVSGSCEGHLRVTPHGGGGFGYDPLFVPNGYTQTFAELSPEVKNEISHRGRAIRTAMENWQAYFSREWPAWPA